MPTLPWSPASSIHSWSFVYLKPAGYAIIRLTTGLRACTPSSVRSLLSFVKRQRDDARARPATANVDVEVVTDGRVLHRQVRHADRLLQERRLCAARDHADLCFADICLVAVARDAPIHHLEPDHLS